MHLVNAKMTDAWRILGKLNYVDAIFNHISTAWIDGRGRIFVSMNPDGVLAVEMRPSDWITVPLDEIDKLNPEKLGVNADGYKLHRLIHKVRARPGSALHTHSENALAVGTTSAGLLPVSQTAVELIPETICVEYQGLFREAEIDPALMGLFETGGVGLLRNHGLLVVAPNIEEAVYLQHYMEVACRVQILALSLGGSPLTPPDHVVTQAATELRKDRAAAAEQLFKAFQRVLLNTRASR
ncbi:ribulose-5-phosphate 4-epimerase/fuculose-1-phosphate aldolase [Bradyrhizobium japonicum]